MTQATARALAERVNMQIIGTLAARRAYVGIGFGDRAAPGAARGAMELAEITEDRRDARGGRVEVIITEAGARTSRRRVPAVLAGMDARDPRRIAADRYAAAAERVGALACASAEGLKADGGPATNDGGVTTRIAHARVTRAVEAVLADAGNVLLPRGKFSEGRRAISARTMIDAICLDGRGIRSILYGHGWRSKKHTRHLTLAAEGILEDMARALGLVSPDAPRPVCNAQDKSEGE